MTRQPWVAVFGFERGTGSNDGRWNGTRLAAAPRDQPQKIAAQHQCFVLGRQIESMDLGKLDAGMQPGPVRPEKHLARTGPLHRLLQ